MVQNLANAEWTCPSTQWVFMTLTWCRQYNRPLPCLRSGLKVFSLQFFILFFPYLLPDAGSLSPLFWLLSGLLLNLNNGKHPFFSWSDTSLQQRSHYHKKENTDRPGRKSAHPAWIIWFDLLEKSWRGHKERKRKHNAPLKYQNNCVSAFALVCLFAGLVCFWAQLLSEQLSSRCWYRAYPETLINS